MNPKYKVGPYYTPKTNIDLGTLNISDQAIILKVYNPLTKYANPPITDTNTAKLWNTHMQFYQNQLNFAVSVATTLCGVSDSVHLNHPTPMIRNFYHFHLYYSIRRVLNQLQIPLPNQKLFNPFNNLFNLAEYQRICDEFNIPYDTDFKQNLDSNHGMGTPYTVDNAPIKYPYIPGYMFLFKDGKFSVTIGLPHTDLPHLDSWTLVDRIEQHHPLAWTNFILDQPTEGGERSEQSERPNQTCEAKRRGFTSPGLVR